MIKFDLERALAGDKVVTRDGREVTQLHVYKHVNASIIRGYDVENDCVEQWLVSGKYHSSKIDCNADLFMAPKKLSGFVNVYKNTVSTCHVSRESADNYVTSMIVKDRLACIDLSQFEEGHGL